jgi:hypothetical protein
MRTTQALVEGIIEVDTVNIPDLTPYMTIANALVTECCGSVGYEDDRLELIERWLSAHFYTVRDPRTTSEKAASVSANYQSAVDIGLNSSHYGQTAMRLDTKGGLAALDAASKAGGKKTVQLFNVGGYEE